MSKNAFIIFLIISAMIVEYWGYVVIIHYSERILFKELVKGYYKLSKRIMKILGLEDLFVNRNIYCDLVILYAECEWWQFLKKRSIQQILDKQRGHFEKALKRLDFIYPLMRRERFSLGLPTKQH